MTSLSLGQYHDLTDEIRHPCERIAYRYLKTLSFSEIRYEPEGRNEPPDFLCDGCLAIEVRRLNQNFDEGHGQKGLEQISIPIKNGMSKLLASFGPPLQHQSWLVFCRFRRPIPEWKLLKAPIKRELKSFKANSNPEPFRRLICRNFELEFHKATKTFPNFFLPGGPIDRNAGGWITSELIRNLRICIADKEQKTANCREKYPVFWLVLVDRISDGIDNYDRQMLKKTELKHSFDKNRAARFFRSCVSIRDRWENIIRIIRSRRYGNPIDGILPCLMA